MQETFTFCSVGRDSLFTISCHVHTPASSIAIVVWSGVRMPFLLVAKVDDNDFSGTIPDAMMSWTVLWKLWFQNNNFTGL